LQKSTSLKVTSRRWLSSSYQRAFLEVDILVSLRCRCHFGHPWVAPRVALMAQVIYDAIHRADDSDAIMGITNDGDSYNYELNAGKPVHLKCDDGRD
jgi:hypothetical protein